MVAPIIGYLSDRHGRRRVLLTAMIGNICSVALWISATDFRTFLASRVVGGLSEANVQLANSIVADITDEASRSASMALVGACFSIAFTFGPMLGAALSSVEVVKANPFVAAALVSFVLILLETIYLWAYLPETHPRFSKLKHVDEAKGFSGEKPIMKTNSSAPNTSPKTTNNPAIISTIYFFFLLPFSGLEFSLPFLVATLHTGPIIISPAALNGRLLSLIGLTSSLLQGTIVRRLPPLLMVRAGIMACALSFFSLAHISSLVGLYAVGGFLAVTTATVVTGLNGLCSLEAGDTDRGVVMGRLRGWGQAGRAAGPIVFCTLFWWAGRQVAYTMGGLAMCVVAFSTFILLESPSLHVKAE